MHFGIGSFYLEITRDSLLIELGRLFAMHAFYEHKASRWGIRWDSINLGQRSWTIDLGPLEFTGSIYWPSPETVGTSCGG